MKRANLTVPEKLKMQRDGYKFFCEHHKTANCAIGENIGLTCVHAPNHKTKEGCRYWKPVHIERKDELIRLRADLAAVTAERNRMQHRLDAAYNVIDKDIKNDMAFAEKHANLWLENERLREALRPFGEALKDNYSMQVDELPIIAGSNQMDIRFKWTLGDLRRARAALDGVD